jgi:hypothetical protein
VPANGTNSGCCFNKFSGPFDGGAPTLSNHDYDGQTRPISTYDVGADEVE